MSRLPQLRNDCPPAPSTRSKRLLWTLASGTPATIGADLAARLAARERVCRRYLRSLIADGGVGKTAVRDAQLISLAIGRALTGDHVFQRCRVLIVSLEDDADELRRRIRAAALTTRSISRELKGWLFLAAPGGSGGKLMTLDERGRPCSRSRRANRARDRRTQIDIVTLDPFVKTHSVDENPNSAIDDVVQVLTDIAAQRDIAVDVPHHVSKGPADPGNANRGRGASAMKDAARLVYTLSPMSPEEAQAFGITEAERRRSSAWIAARSTSPRLCAEAKWFRLVGVSLGNGTDLYPNGDEVQTVEMDAPQPVAWAWPARCSTACSTEIDVGLARRQPLFGGRSARGPSGLAHRSIKHAPDKTEAQAREVIKEWLKSGLLVSEHLPEPEVPASPSTGLRVDATRTPVLSLRHDTGSDGALMAHEGLRLIMKSRLRGKAWRKAPRHQLLPHGAFMAQRPRISTRLRQSNRPHRTGATTAPHPPGRGIHFLQSANTDRAGTRAQNFPGQNFEVRPWV